MSRLPLEPQAEPGVHLALGILWRRRRLIAAVTGLLTIITVLISLAMPRTYTAHTVLLPPISMQPGSALAAGLSQSFGFLGIRDESFATARLFEQVLDSRTVLEAVIRREGLLKWYRLTDKPERKAMEESTVLLSRAMRTSLTDEGVIDLSIRMTTPWFSHGKGDNAARELAASVANVLVEELDKVNREKSLSRAKQTRQYLERQIDENTALIGEQNLKLAEFRKEHGAIALDAQTKALIESAAQLKSQILSKDIELAMARRTMTPDNPLLSKLETEAAFLRRGLANMEDGSSSSSTDGLGARTKVDVPVGEIPELQSKLADLQGELENRLLLQTYLQQQYYQAKVEEARDTPTVQVLDQAIPPVERTSPKRKLMVVGAVLSGLLIGVLAAAVAEGIERRA